MEHIVQFAIGIDDNAIVERVTANAEKEIIKELQQQVANKLFQRNYYNRNADPERDPLSEFSLNMIDDFFDKHKDTIIEKAAERLADRLSRTKKAKEILNDIHI